MRFHRTPIVVAALIALAATSPPTTIHAQGTAADTAKWRADSVDFATIARDKTAPSYSKQAQARLRARDSLHLRPVVVTPPPVVTPPTPPPVQTPAVATLAIHGTGATLAVGSTMLLYGEPKDANGTTLLTPIAWSATPSDVGTISGTGLVTAKAAGALTVTARADTVAVSRVFTVTGGTTPPPTPTPLDTPVVVTSPPTPPTPTSGTLAELPRTIMSVPYPACTRTTRVASGGDLQAALNASAWGDCIAVPAGATFVGNYTWPNKTGSGWVTLLTEFPTAAALPPPGTRMTPSRCAAIGCAKILSPNYTEAIGTAPGAHSLIVRGIEISTTPAAIATSMNVLVRISDAGFTSDTTRIPSSFVFDRDYIHGLSTLDIRRCVLFNSRLSALVDSWVSECHSNNSDSQAVLGYSGTCGILVQNSYLSAGHEIVMFGGVDPPGAAFSPCDVTLRANHITHPAAWFKVWQVKNCIETKNVSRLLIEANVIENCWPDAQAGFAFVLKSENQGGGAPYTTTSDVTIRYNIVRNVASGFNISGSGSNGTPNVTSARFAITDNLVQNFQPAPWGGDGIAVQILSNLTDAVIARNTMRNGPAAGSSISLSGAPAATRLVFTGNAFHAGQYGVKCSGFGTGLPSLTACTPGAVFTDNVIVGTTCGGYPTTTLCPAAFPALPTATSGADTVKILAMTAGVVVIDAASVARAAPNPRSLRYTWRRTDPTTWADYPRPWSTARGAARRTPPREPKVQP